MFAGCLRGNRSRIHRTGKEWKGKATGYNGNREQRDEIWTGRWVRASPAGGVGSAAEGGAQGGRGGPGWWGRTGRAVGDRWPVDDDEKERRRRRSH